MAMRSLESASRIHVVGENGKHGGAIVDSVAVRQIELFSDSSHSARFCWMEMAKRLMYIDSRSHGGVELD